MSGLDKDSLAMWLKSQVVSAKGREAYNACFRLAVENLLDAPVDTLFVEDELRQAFERTWTPSRAKTWARASVRGLLGTLVQRRRLLERSLGDVLSAETFEELLDLVSREGLIQPEWVYEVFGQRAAEVLITDVLVQTLGDFSRVIPRVVQGLMPSPLGRFGKLGGRAGRLGGRLIEELEARLEPEVRRFAEGGSRQALAHAADFLARNLDAPFSREARRSVVSFGLKQPMTFHLEPIDADFMDDIETVFEKVAHDVACDPGVRDAVWLAVSDFLDTHRGHTLSECLQALGFSEVPPVDAWTEATWPVVSRFLSSPEFAAWLEPWAQALLLAFAGAPPTEPEGTPPEGR